MDDVFLGIEAMTVDDKGRVALPARFANLLRRTAGEETGTIGLRLTPERSIKLMPPGLFDRELARWDKLDDDLDEERLVLNLSASLAERVALDKQNRFKLNALMMEVCQVQREVVIVGSIRYMQLYAAEVWRAMVERDLPRMGEAMAKVSGKGQPPAPVQYIIQATPPEAGGGKPSR
jgi:MraZ protein